MVVFFDIDGTLVDDDSQVIPASAVEAVKQLRLNGHTPVVNTGRPYSHIDPRCGQVFFATPKATAAPPSATSSAHNLYTGSTAHSTTNTSAIA